MFISEIALSIADHLMTLAVFGTTVGCFSTATAATAAKNGKSNQDQYHYNQ
jgi:hypothetical protein